MANATDLMTAKPGDTVVLMYSGILRNSPRVYVTATVTKVSAKLLTIRGRNYEFRRVDGKPRHKSDRGQLLPASRANLDLAEAWEAIERKRQSANTARAQAADAANERKAMAAARCLIARDDRTLREFIDGDALVSAFDRLVARGWLSAEDAERPA